jgi:hypothetical protein
MQQDAVSTRKACSFGPIDGTCAGALLLCHVLCRGSTAGQACVAGEPESEPGRLQLPAGRPDLLAPAGHLMLLQAYRSSACLTPSPLFFRSCLQRSGTQTAEAQLATLQRGCAPRVQKHPRLHLMPCVDCGAVCGPHRHAPGAGGCVH